VVAVQDRSWRIYIGPAIVLVAATIAVVVVRHEWRHASRPPASPPTHVGHRPAPAHGKPVYYVVRAGDTLDAIAARVKVSVRRLLKLNPRVSPTALFIGEKIRVR